MAIGTRTENGRTGRRTGLARLGLSGPLSRYDLVLFVIPLAFLFALVLGAALPVPTSAALVGAALCGVAVVTDALFLNPPTAR